MNVQPRNRWLWGGRAALALLAAPTVSGCGTEMQELHRLKWDLDMELSPFANTAEENARGSAGHRTLYQDLLAEVRQEEGLWLDPLNPQWGLEPLARRWHRGRGMAEDVERRIVAALGTEEAESFPMTSQVRWAKGLSELYLGMTFCTAVLDEAELTDVAVLQKAERSLGRAIESARSSGETQYLNAARAARAQARMLLGDWTGAESDAMEVPAGFSYDSYHSSDSNPLVQVIGSGAVGFLHKWWPLVEESEDPGFMTDPWSGEPDRRIPVHYDGGTMSDWETPHYRPLKYDSPDDDIPIVHYDLAQLIIAEAKAARGDYGGATAVLNGLRAAVGLPPHDVPTTAEEMEELILWERFAELHLEGQRLIDLHRKGLMEAVFEELNDPERPGVGRPSKWGDCEGS